MRAQLLLALAALAASGCMVPREAYLAKSAEADRSRLAYQAESERNERNEAKLRDLVAEVKTLEADGKALGERLRTLEDHLATKQADLREAQERADRFQALADELAHSKDQLLQAKEALEKKSAEYESVSRALKSEIEAGQIEVSELRGRMTVKVADRILFASGSASIGPEGLPALRKLADACRGLKGRAIRVEGHTDNVPTTSSTFPTNWELSAARATAVVRLLTELGMDPTLLSAAGFANFQPVASNETAAGRALNRRIEIVLMPAEGTRANVPLVAAGGPPEPAKVPKSKGKRGRK